jgi:hypothetical protein
MSWFVILPVLPILLAYLGGVTVALILVIRQRSLPAILALIGFTVLAAMVLFNFLRAPVIEFMVRGRIFRNPGVAHAGLGCCCSVFDVAAIVCLITALWQALAGRSAGSAI